MAPEEGGRSGRDETRQGGRDAGAHAPRRVTRAGAGGEGAWSRDAAPGRGVLRRDARAARRVRWGPEGGGEEGEERGRGDPFGFAPSWRQEPLTSVGSGWTARPPSAAGALRSSTLPRPPACLPGGRRGDPEWLRGDGGVPPRPCPSPPAPPRQEGGPPASFLLPRFSQAQASPVAPPLPPCVLLNAMSGGKAFFWVVIFTGGTVCLEGCLLPMYTLGFGKKISYPACFGVLACPSMLAFVNLCWSLFSLVEVN